MKTKCKLLFLTLCSLTLLCVPTFGQRTPNRVTITRESINILGTSIPVNIYKNATKRSTLTYISLHHNEELGLRLAKDAIKTSGGKLVEVVSVGPGNKPRRLLHFKHKDKDLCVDPNRIFSLDGIRSSLKEIGTSNEGCQNNENSDTKGYIKEAVVENAIENFKGLLLSFCGPIPATGALVSVHNNKVNGSISVKSFITRNDDEYENNEGTYVARDDLKCRNQDNDTDDDTEYKNCHDFFMVTNRYLLSKLTRIADEHTFSIGLQKQNPDESKGYLSVYCSLKNINYIIIEAEHKFDGKGSNHEVRQQAMIDRIIKAFAPPTR